MVGTAAECYGVATNRRVWRNSSIVLQSRDKETGVSRSSDLIELIFEFASTFRIKRKPVSWIDLSSEHSCRFGRDALTSGNKRLIHHRVAAINTYQHPLLSTHTNTSCYQHIPIPTVINTYQYPLLSTHTNTRCYQHIPIPAGVAIE